MEVTKAWSADLTYTHRDKVPHSTEHLQAMMKDFSLTTESMKTEHKANGVWQSCCGQNNSVGAKRSSPDGDKPPKEKLD